MANDSPYRTLAEILTSCNVGLTHIHLVGEVVVAQSALNEWFAEKTNRRLASDEWIDIAEEILAVEDGYKLLWAELNCVGGTGIGPAGLRLENTLRKAASTLREIHDRLRNS